MADMADITDKITDIINTVADKAREYGEIAKLQALIKAEEAKKQEFYYQLGKKYYEIYKDAPASDLTEIMKKLLASDEKISDYKEDLKTASAKEAEEAADESVPDTDAGSDDTVTAQEKVADNTEDFSEE